MKLSSIIIIFIVSSKQIAELTLSFGQILSGWLCLHNWFKWVVIIIFILKYIHLFLSLGLNLLLRRFPSIFIHIFIRIVAYFVLLGRRRLNLLYDWRFVYYWQLLLLNRILMTVIWTFARIIVTWSIFKLASYFLFLFVFLWSRHYFNWWLCYWLTEEIINVIVLRLIVILICFLLCILIILFIFINKV